MIQQKCAALKLRILKQPHLQVCDVIHDGPAFNRMTPRVDEMIVDLKTQKQHNKLRTQIRFENQNLTAITPMNLHYGKPEMQIW